MNLGRLVPMLAPNLLLAALVLWRIWGPLRPSRRATCWFAAGTLLALTGLVAGLTVTLGSL